MEPLLMWYTCTCTLQTYRDTILFCRLINVDILLLFLTIFIRNKAEIKDNRHIIDAIYICTFSSLFIDRIDINLIPYHINELWTSGYNNGLVIWRLWRVGGSNPTVHKIFCNVYLFRVPRSWTGTIQMKSSMTFIRGNRCIEREKDNFKICDVKRLKECAIALR